MRFSRLVYAFFQKNELLAHCIKKESILMGDKNRKCATLHALHNFGVRKIFLAYKWVQEQHGKNKVLNQDYAIFQKDQVANYIWNSSLHPRISNNIRVP